MLINPFKLISFNSKYWKENDLCSFLDNNDTKDKVIKTKSIMDFLRSNISKGYAKIEKSDGLYVLMISDDLKSVTSIIGEIDYNEKDVLFPNEETNHQKLEAYKDIFNEYKLQINPVLTFYKEGPSIESIIKDIIIKEPDISAIVNETNYKLWKINNIKELEMIKNSLSKIDKLYIADGHHRFSIFHDSYTKNNAKIMVSITDCDSILLKSCHRVITTDINNNWKELISKYCTLERIDVLNNYDNDNDLKIIFRDGKIYKVTLKNEFCKSSIHSIVNNLIIRDSFGIVNLQNNVFPIPGNIKLSDSSKIFDLYKNSNSIVFIPDLKVSQFLSIIENGKRLPPTSTWFEPKIIDGFLISKY